MDDWDKWLDDYEKRHGSVQHTKKIIDQFDGTGIVSNIENHEQLNLHYIGKLNTKIYECVTKDITTDEVIITTKQIEHIKSRHPGDYENYSTYLPEIIRSPDYIIEANKADSALVLKEIDIAGEKFKVIVRITTSRGAPNYKNSVITFMKINSKEWNRLLKNKKILYKKE